MLYAEITDITTERIDTVVIHFRNPDGTTDTARMSYKTFIDDVLKNIKMKVAITKIADLGWLYCGLYPKE